MTDRRARRTSRVQRARRSREHARDEQTASPFAAILGALLSRLPGARGAALVDADGETVDYAGRIEPFDLRVAAAHWQIVLDELRRTRAFASARSFAVRADEQSYVVWALPEDGYAIVVLLGRRAGMGAPSRAFVACERALCDEAGWPRRASLPRWFPVDVECDRRKRPVHVREHDGRVDARRKSPEKTAHLHEVHVLGALVASTGALTGRERGFRVRLASGAEITLLREPGGFWYADDELDLADPTQNTSDFQPHSASAQPHKKKR